MTINTSIEGRSGRIANVDADGAVYVQRPHFSRIASVNLNSTNVFNLLRPVRGRLPLITSLTVRANRNVSNTVDATVRIYQSTSPASAVATRNLATVQVSRFERFPVNDEFLVDGGVWVNADTTDADIDIIFGYQLVQSQDTVEDELANRARGADLA